MKTNIMKKLSLFAVAFAFCAAICAKPIDANAALTKPTNLTQTDALTTSSACEVELQWDHTATYYSIEYSMDKIKWTMEHATWYNNTKTISNLTPASTYYFKVTPYDGSEKGAPAELTVTTAPRNTSLITQTGANASSTNISVSWAPTTGADGYLVTYGTSSKYADSVPYNNTNGITTATSLTLTVPKNASYYLFVVPYKGNWLSGSYAYQVVTTAPTAPSDLWVYQTKTENKEVTFNWIASSNVTNTSGYEFEVYRVTKANGKTKRLKKVDIKDKYSYSTTVKSAKLFSAGYKYRIRAYVTINGVKYPGEWSKFYTYVPCAKIKGKLSNQTSSSATLSWNKVLGATSYTVYHKTSLYGKWKAVKKNVKGTSATVKYSKSSIYNYYCVKANKVKIDKKKYSSPNPNSKNAYSYSEFKKRYYYY